MANANPDQFMSYQYYSLKTPICPHCQAPMILKQVSILNNNKSEMSYAWKCLCLPEDLERLYRG